METNQRLTLTLDRYREALIQMDRQKAVEAALKSLKGGLGIVPLYSRVIAPALNEIVDESSGSEAWIWKEHVRSSIVRSTVECCFSYVIAERQALRETDGMSSSKGKVVLFCPAEELHDLGARMGADFFCLAGYDAIFVGSNTPDSTILEGLKIEKPELVVIHVVNQYHVFRLKHLMPAIREASPGSLILVSGYAFAGKPSLVDQVGADGFVNSYEDIVALGQQPAGGPL